MRVMVATSVRTVEGRRAAPDQEIRFCRGSDNVRIAYAAHGSGPPLIVVSCWLSHLQHDWQSPVWRHFLDDLGEIATVVRYDERGFGLSDWNVSDFSLQARLADLEALIEKLGLPRFVLLGMSAGAPIAMAYAARNPERVSRMILYGAALGGRLLEEPEAKDEEETLCGLIRIGWAKPDPLFRRVFTSIFVPGATEEQKRWFDDLQRTSTSMENAIASRLGRQEVDIQDELPSITAPTVVLHATGDRAVGFDQGMQIASLIPNARLVPMDSRNHVLLADEPAWRTFMDEVRAFLEPERQATAGRADITGGLGTLSVRERDVLRLTAEGLSNDEIAAELTLSARTVERHLSNVYEKLGVSGRAARAAAVATFLRQHS